MVEKLEEKKQNVIQGNFEAKTNNVGMGKEDMQAKQEQALEYLSKAFNVNKEELKEWESDIHQFVQDISITKEAKHRIKKIKNWIEEDQPTLKTAIGLDALLVFVLMASRQQAPTMPQIPNQ